MLVVKIELWPHGQESKARELVRVFIANNNTGTATLGNYDVAVMRKGEKRAPWPIGNGKNTVVKPLHQALVTGYARKSQSVLHLVRKTIEALYPDKG